MIVALQYHEGDLEQTMALARLLADLEARPRGDVILALVCQPGTPKTPLVEATIAHCRRKLEVEWHESPLGALGHPAGCTALWTGTAMLYRTGRREHRSIFMLDGGDGIPLHRDWIDLAKHQHEITLAQGKLITGTPYFLGTCPLHVNPNAIFEVRIFEETRLLTDVPRHDGTLATHFDIYHREIMLDWTRPSSIVRTDWRGGGEALTSDLLRERARESIWLHGHKDRRLYFLAREHCLSSPPAPTIKEYDLFRLRLQEQIRRSYEEASR